MSWCWLALVPDTPADCLAAAPVTDWDGAPYAVLAAWDQGEPRPGSAARIDSRAIDPAGAAADVSLVLLPEDVVVRFDDLSVSACLRRTLALPPAAVMSTLTIKDDRFAGSLTATRGDVNRLRNDPFDAAFRGRLLRVGAGLLGAMPAPVGPVIQRYGPGNPWPWDAFPSR